MGGHFLLSSSDQIIIYTFGRKRYSYCQGLTDQDHENHIWYQKVGKAHFQIMLSSA